MKSQHFLFLLFALPVLYGLVMRFAAWHFGRQVVAAQPPKARYFDQWGRFVRLAPGDIKYRRNGEQVEAILPAGVYSVAPGEKGFRADLLAEWDATQAELVQAFTRVKRAEANTLAEYAGFAFQAAMDKERLEILQAYREALRAPMLPAGDELYARIVLPHVGTSAARAVSAPQVARPARPRRDARPAPAPAPVAEPEPVHAEPVWEDVPADAIDAEPHWDDAPMDVFEPGDPELMVPDDLDAEADARSAPASRPFPAQPSFTTRR